jgi:hypothetical protein
MPGPPARDRAGAGVFPPQFSSRITSTRSTVPSTASTTSSSRSRCSCQRCVLRLHVQLMPSARLQLKGHAVRSGGRGQGRASTAAGGEECSLPGCPPPDSCHLPSLGFSRARQVCQLADEQELPASTARPVRGRPRAEEFSLLGTPHPLTCPDPCAPSPWCRPARASSRCARAVRGRPGPSPSSPRTPEGQPGSSETVLKSLL